MNKYLPIGSVVLLKEAEKRLMIYGLKQKDSNTGKTWDYVACMFPEGNIDLEHTYLFNHEQIQNIYYIGLQDEEQYEFNKYLMENLVIDDNVKI